MGNDENNSSPRRKVSIGCPPMPWFGMDIGGTLTKLVYFEPADTKYLDEHESELAKTIHHYLVNNQAYGESGVRDYELQLNNVVVNNRKGTLHFIRFPTEKMSNFIKLAKSKGFAMMSSTVCATGGGAIKFFTATEEELHMKMRKSDELVSLIKGIELVTSFDPDECYYYDNPLDPQKCKKVIWRWSSGRCSSMDQLHAGQPIKEGLQYPYVVCNIGSGVSVLVVRSHENFQRVSGSSIGGGFFQGLCSLLCKCDTFEEAIELAAKGDNANVDKLVKDIYGSGYESVGLPGNIVAASFGKVCNKEAREKCRPEDLARSALVTTANNIGSIALNIANQQKVDRIVFVGNFLRVNPIAARHLSHAMEFWSNGTKKALFLNHEGYFGAVGCLDKLVDLDEHRTVVTINGHTNIEVNPQ
ncbi:unnamed protein product [Bursaphelenchus okinawaensis]|uniref:pantothenate kinase n=1 Tax=Bursaphelenchus okinawaensis TaxID=465554 RepID=A0A811KT10_9BILA|nr:unnamed protein product [Bursaphelenchus okinawaensis]CAG9111577.1 unnamed protein product [Bursaphelenchus okinawaensis]